MGAALGRSGWKNLEQQTPGGRSSASETDGDMFYLALPQGGAVVLLCFCFCFCAEAHNLCLVETRVSKLVPAAGADTV